MTTKQITRETLTALLADVAKHIADAKTPATDEPELPRVPQRDLKQLRADMRTSSIIGMMEDDARAAVMRAGLIELILEDGE